MTTSEKLQQAFNAFRPHITGHNSSINLFLQGIGEVETMRLKINYMNKESEDLCKVIENQTIEIDALKEKINSQTETILFYQKIAAGS